MAGFQSHMTGSTLLGLGYGAVGYTYGLPLSTCLVAGGACSVSGMLPDLDSDSGVPVREMLCFLASVIPVFLLPRFHQLGLQHEHLVLAAVAAYLAIRFGVGEIFRRYTVHRGMWHSLPAAAIAGLLTFLLDSGDEIGVRWFKAGAVVLGFITHLVMDEFWSVDLRRGIPRLKNSAGTALKLWTNKSMWANISTYGKLAGLVFIVIGDPYLMNQLGVDQGPLPRSTNEWVSHTVDQGQHLVRRLLRRQGRLVDGPLNSSAPRTDFFGPVRERRFGGDDQRPVSPAETTPDAPRQAGYGDGPAAETARRFSVPLPGGQSQPAAGSYRNPPPDTEAARMPSYYPTTGSPDRR